MSQKGEYKPKYSNKVEQSEFSTDYGVHHILHIPLNVNKKTGFGKLFGMGLSKILAILKPESLIAMRAFAEEHPEEGQTEIKEDAHVGNEWDK